MSRLTGKKIFVTGGSRGIGASIVRTLAAEGAQVIFSYASREDAAREVLSKLPGEGHLIYKMNLCDEGNIEQVFREVSEKLGELDGLVNNAGVTKDQLLLRMKSEDFDMVLNANLRGSFLVTRAALKGMLRARKGSIVSVTSVIGQTGNAGQANYSASKAGLIAFSKSVALEVASRGIRVNCVAPGFIATDMTETMTSDARDNVMKRIPLASIGHAQDVAQSVLFLLSDESKYITGHTLNVNGGMYMN